MKINLNLATLLITLRRFGPSLAGLAIAAVFGYTGWVINQAFNVQPAASSTTSTPAKVVFDKKTIETVKNLRVIPGQVSPGSIGKTDPFGN